MSALNFQVLVDLTGGGSPTTDITQWVKSGQLQIGRSDPTKWAADGGSGNLVLNNTDRRFSPAYSAGAYFGQLVPLRAVQISLNGQVRFVGFVTEWTPSSGINRSRECNVTLIDRVAYLQRHTIYSPARLGMTGDQLVAGVINTAFGATVNSAVFTFGSLPADSTTVSITYNGATVTYKFKTTTLANAYDVKADTIANACANLAACINQTEGSGTTYVSGVPPQNFTATATSTTVTITQVIPGATGAGFTLASGTVAVTAGATSGGADAPAGAFSFETGIQTFTRVGQNWGAINAMTAVEEITRSENGRFFAQTDGTLTWCNRNHWFLKLVASPVLTLDGDPMDVQGSTTEAQIYNQVNVTFYPQDTQSNSVIAKATSPITVPGSSSTTFKLPFVDPVTAKQGTATALILPLVPATDWVANEKTDNSGVDYATGVPGYVTFSYLILANEIQITVKNAATGTLYLTKFQIRGSMVTSYNPITLQKNDVASPYKYTKPMKVDMPIGQDANYADSLGNYLLSKYKTATFRVSQIDMGPISKGFPSITAAQTKIDDLILLGDSQQGFSGSKYLVLGIRSDWQAGEAINYQFLVERMDDVTYWILGDATYGALGTTTRLAI